MDIENAAKTNALYRLLCQIEDLRDRKGDWLSATYNVTPRFPKETQQKIKAFITRKQRENVKNLLGFLENARSELLKLLNTPAENVKKGDEIRVEMERLGRVKEIMGYIDAKMAELDAGTAASLLDFMWTELGKYGE